jgi:hypothetical protein
MHQFLNHLIFISQKSSVDEIEGIVNGFYAKTRYMQASITTLLLFNFIKWLLPDTESCRG